MKDERLSLDERKELYQEELDTIRDYEQQKRDGANHPRLHGGGEDPGGGQRGAGPLRYLPGPWEERDPAR